MAEIVELYEAALTEERDTSVLKQVADKQAHAGENLPVPGSEPQVHVAVQASADCARQVDLLRTARREKGPTGAHHRGTKSPYVSRDRAQRLTMDTNHDPCDICDLVETFVFDTEGFEDLLRSETIREIQRIFGRSWHFTGSNRHGEYGVFEVSCGNKRNALTFLLPFNKAGAWAGAGRIVSRNRHGLIDFRVKGIDIRGRPKRRGHRLGHHGRSSWVPSRQDMEPDQRICGQLS